MAALATVADVQARLASTLTSAEEVRVAALIDDATAAVRAYTRQTISRATTTDRLMVRIPRGDMVVVLPQRPVTSITTVTDLVGNTVAYEWDGLQTLEINGRTDLIFTIPATLDDDLAVVDVTYDHGLDVDNDGRDILGTVRSIIAGGIVARAFGTPSEQAGKTAETIGGYSYQIGPAAAQGSFGLLNSEKAALRAAVGIRRGGSIFL